MRFIISLILLICVSKYASAQSIENVDFEVYDYNIKINFDLVNCPDNTLYNLRVVFTKPDGTSVYPLSITNLNGVAPGRNKTLIWDYKSDKVEYTGQLNVSVSIIEAVEMPPPPRLKHGPGNAVLSLILPGWGDFHVNETDKFTPLLVTAAYLGAGYMSYSSLNAANASYDKYLAATTQSAMDEHFSAAEAGLNQSKMYLGVAATILVVDFIHVIVKGNKNIRNGSFSSNNLRFIPKITNQFGSTAYNFSLIKKF